MAVQKTSRHSSKQRSWAVRLALIVLAVYLFLKAVQIYGQIREKREAMADYDARIQTQIVVNEGLADQVDNADDYLEHKANEDGYYLPGQQVFQNEAG